MALILGQFASAQNSPQASKFKVKGLGLGLPSSRPQIKVEARFRTYPGGNRVLLEVAADVGPDWYVYSTTQPEGGPIRTTIDLELPQGARLTSPFEPDQPPKIERNQYFPVPQEKHYGRVVWHAAIELPVNTVPEQLEIRGKINGQMCREGACVPLDTQKTDFVARHAGTVAVRTTEPPATALPTDSGASTSGTSTSGASTPPLKSVPLKELMPHLWWGFLGGLLLNLMPCVLPVIGLKIMSFVEQSRGNRGEALRLNAIYSMGVIAVFLALAMLSVILNLSWGEQFTFAWFKIAMIVLVFSMALSFLGVWEIPIPGFVGSGTAGDLAAREGLSGAFFKGVFATVLATPCSGPLMGPIFAFTLGKPTYVTYAVFGSMGLGMSAPYILVGLFPELIRWLPKPGAWMDTFKQLMGFLLLFTVVFLFYTLGNKELFVPTFALLIAVWFACWLIGRVPFTAAAHQRIQAWAVGTVFATLIGVGAYRYLGPHETHVAWRPFTPAALAEAQQSGKTVIVDVSANWCLTCKLNLAVALDTPRVGELIRKHEVVPFLADWTDRSETIKSYIASLGQDAIPLFVVYPAGNPSQPLVIPDILTENLVIDALQTAGPSQSVAANNRMVPN